MMRTRERMMRLLGLDELAYGEAVMRMGEAYLEYYCMGVSWARRYLAGKRAYWRWWMDQMDVRDEAFLARWEGRGAEREMLRQRWEAAHRPEAVEGRVPDALWRVMLKEVREEEREKEKEVEL